MLTAASAAPPLRFSSPRAAVPANHANAARRCRSVRSDTAAPWRMALLFTNVESRNPATAKPRSSTPAPSSARHEATVHSACTPGRSAMVQPRSNTPAPGRGKATQQHAGPRQGTAQARSDGTLCSTVCRSAMANLRSSTPVPSSASYDATAHSACTPCPVAMARLSCAACATGPRHRCPEKQHQARHLPLVSAWTLRILHSLLDQIKL